MSMVMTTSPKRSVIISFSRERFHLMDLAQSSLRDDRPDSTKSGLSAFAQNRPRITKTAHYLFSLDVRTSRD